MTPDMEVKMKMSDFETRDYAAGYRDGKRDAEDTITRLTAENERLRAALKENALVLPLPKEPSNDT
jgi:hypothetical protein